MAVAVSIRTKPLSQSVKAADKRAAILRAAIEIINRKGFANATMTDIAARLGWRDAALYYYFPNKQALVHACHLDSLDRFDVILDRVEAYAGCGAVKLERFLVLFIEDSEANGPQLYFGEHSYLTETQRRAVDDWAARLTERLEALVESGIADGSMRRCETGLVVQLILGMLIWLAKWVPDVEGLTAQRLLDAMGVTIFAGLRASAHD